MGSSAKGIIFHGVVFDEDFEFPWGDGDIDDWWLDVLGYKNKVEIFDGRGMYLSGFNRNSIEIPEYFSNRREFLNNNPIPVDVVNICTGDFPIYALAVPSTHMRSYGYAKEFSPDSLRVSDEEVNKFCDFCKKYGIAEFVPHDLHWQLASFYG